ncbi:MAG: erythromycin esterase family protein [Actinobacteria bacterium]|uniref:Unannotated protein n=1 Tax=freshwater metagenome TaxID=449393 RepID=A0A6J7E6M5_9ZZZZ|nr:erythromycin esterase family protein [Actinomycetota bacterium]
MSTHTWTSPTRQITGLHSIKGRHDDYDGLLELVGDRRFVLIGEASHGTHDFYRERARITERLIEEKGFAAVVVEADWPDAYRVNRYVRGRSLDPDANAALGDFKRFPSWMWRNTDVVNFVEWLRRFNAGQVSDRLHAGFYGLDLYSLRASMDAVVGYLERVDEAGAQAARDRYACFDLFAGEGQHYGHAVSLNVAAPCEDEVVGELIDLRERQAAILSQDGHVERDDYFYAEQNARLVLNAERYYREMYRGRISSWNLRDTHMAETLQSLIDHLDAENGRTKVVVWAHNSHLGDARSTDMGRGGELNLGQIVRQRFSGDNLLIGFTTDHGRVTAASEWGGPAERKRVRPALPNSYEHAFHELGIEAFWLPLIGRQASPVPDNLLERAIGVIYRPETERTSHWFHADLASQFDVVIHVDHTSALTPLERTPLWDMGEPPETYPTGL